MSTVTVSTTAGLLNALKSAVGNTLILLDPGTYSGVNILNIKPKGGAVWIESASPASPAVLTDLNVSASTDIAFAHLEMSTVGTPVGQWGARATIPFSVYGSNNIVFENDLFTGSPTGTLANTVSGLLIENSADVAVGNSEFQYLHWAITHQSDTGLFVENNFFRNLYDCGVRGGGTSDVVISGNRFTTMHMDPTDTDHPDCIQFWTSGTTTSATSITVKDNIYTQGAGNPVQGIFFGNELDIPYKNIVVEDNVMVGSLWNGIAVGDADNVDLAGNTVAGFAGMLARIVLQGDTNVNVSGNAATAYLNLGGNAELVYNSDTWIDPVRDGGAALLKTWLAKNPGFVKLFGAQGASLTGEPATTAEKPLAVAAVRPSSSESTMITAAAAPHPSRFVAEMAVIGGSSSGSIESSGGQAALKSALLTTPGIVHDFR